MKKLLTTLTLLTFYFQFTTVFAQPTEPILRLNTEMHTAMIRRISTDAQGKYILTVSDDKTAKLWSAATGKILRTFRPPIGYGYEGMLFAGAISPDAKIVAVGGWTSKDGLNNNIYIFNTATGEMIQRLSGLGNVISDLEFSPDGKFLAAALGGGEGVVIYKISPFKGSKGDVNLVKYKTLTGYGYESYNVAYDKSGRFATVFTDGKIRLYDNNFNLIKKRTGAGSQPYSIAFSPDGSKIAVGYMDVPDVEVFSAQNLKRLYKPQLDGMKINQGLSSVLSFSADGKYLFGGGYYRKYIDGYWWVVIRKWANAGRGSYTDYPTCGNTVLDLKSLGSYLLFAGYQPDFGKIDLYGNKIFYKAGEIFDFTANNKSHFKINSTGDKIAFTPLYKEVVLFSVADRKLIEFEDQSGLDSYTDNKSGISITDWLNSYSPKINGKKLNFLKKNEHCRSTDISPDGSKIVFGADWNIYCTDASGNVLWETPVQGTAWAVNISGNGKVVAVAQGGGAINWYRMSDGKLLLSLYVHPQDNHWILFTQEGYFDASPGAEEFVGWHINQGLDKEARFYPLSQFYEKFYVPNLGARILAGEDITSDVNINNLKLPPFVKITFPKDGAKLNTKQLAVTIEVTDQGGGIDEVRLYLNDKLVQTTQRGFVRIQQNGNTITKTFKITLANGQNRIKATAFSKQRTESIADEIAVFYEGVKKTANLYALIIGINNYKNPKYKLNYALADATAFKQEIENGTQSIFRSVNITFLTDANASRQNIMQEFNKLESQVKPDDVFIFYYAGHGVMSIDDKVQFYIIPYDVTQLYGDNQMLSSNAISAEELQNFSTQLQAQKQMFVLDACQSGGITETLVARGAAEEKAIAQLARSTGTYWLTASKSEQFASEFSQLGHGVFTYAILLGLQGQADGGSRDGKITVKELSAFLNDKVPELSEKYKGEAQYPMSYGYGQDFPIVIVK